MTTKFGPPVNDWFSRSATKVPGRFPAPFAYTRTFTEAAGPPPSSYAPWTSTPVTFQPGPAGTTKSSAASSSSALFAVS